MAKFPTAVISTVNGVRDWFPSHATTEKIPVMKAGIESAGHVDIQVVELPEPMTRAAARDYLSTNGMWATMSTANTTGDKNMSATIINHPNPTNTMSAYDIMMQQAKGMRDRAEVLTKQAQQAHELIKEAEKIEKAAAPLAPKTEKKVAPKKETAKPATAPTRKQATKTTAARKRPTHEAPRAMQSAPVEPTVIAKGDNQPTA